MCVQAKDEVLEVLAASKEKIRAFGVKRIGLFGSFARDCADEESDVDLLVEFHPKSKTFDNFMGLAFLLEEHLGRKVEVLTPESLSPCLGPTILDEVEYATVG